MDRETLRDWVHRYNAEALSGLYDRVSPSPEPRLSAAQLAGLGAIVEAGPDPGLDGVVHWRRVDLQKVNRAPVRRAPARTLGRHGAGPDGLPPPLGAAASPGEGACGAGGVQGNFVGLVKAALPEHAAGKPIEIWFRTRRRSASRAPSPASGVAPQAAPRAVRPPLRLGLYLRRRLPARGAGASVISTRLAVASLPMLMPSSSSTASAGKTPPIFASRKMSPSCRCRPTRPTEPGRKHLALCQAERPRLPRLGNLRRHRRDQLPRLEQAHRPTATHSDQFLHANGLSSIRAIGMRTLATRDSDGFSHGHVNSLLQSSFCQNCSCEQVLEFRMFVGNARPYTCQGRLWVNLVPCALIPCALLFARDHVVS